MPPKDAPRKPPPAMIRPAISDSSLFYIPDDVMEGFQERIETGIDWTLIELAARHQKKKCKQEDIPTVAFSKALKTKIDNSILGAFLKEDSSFTLDQQWELLPMTLWDIEKLANDEGKICFNNANNITDDMLDLIKRAVALGDRKALKKYITQVKVLRVNHCKMTELDKDLQKFKEVVNLNLCGNYLDQIDSSLIPPCVRSLELQANRIKCVDGLAEHLSHEMLYLGLARNFLKDESVGGLSCFPHSLVVLDLSDNDIYDLEPLLDALVCLPSLTSLMLVGNPCSVCMGYARITLMRLQRLKWLDSREILPTDRTAEHFEPHPHDFRSSFFNFTVFRVMSVAQPPKAEKGVTTTFHIELEIPLLDSQRRQFLMFHRNESLIEMFPPPEDDEWPHKQDSAFNESKILPILCDESSSNDDIYKALVTKNSREIFHFTTLESNRVQWNKVMNFTEPTVKIFCPDLVALRDTFRTVITIRLVYSVTPTGKAGKSDRKSTMAFKMPVEQRLVLATIRCALKQPDWSQSSQHFHWDDSLGTNDAIHWGDGDLSVLQYSLGPGKPTSKGKSGDSGPDTSRQNVPDNLTCHFGFGIDTLRL